MARAATTPLALLGWALAPVMAQDYTPKVGQHHVEFTLPDIQTGKPVWHSHGEPPFRPTVEQAYKPVPGATGSGTPWAMPGSGGVAVGSGADVFISGHSG